MEKALLLAAKYTLHAYNTHKRASGQTDEETEKMEKYVDSKLDSAIDEGIEISDQIINDEEQSSADN